VPASGTRHPNQEIEVIQEPETRRRCLETFAASEMATLTDAARTLWLFVYAANCESSCHCGEAGTRDALSWMDAETFDRAFDDLRERRLIVRSVYDEQLLLEAITPALADEDQLW
jgi:hypothetical protein